MLSYYDAQLRAEFSVVTFLWIFIIIIDQMKVTNQGKKKVKKMAHNSQLVILIRYPLAFHPASTFHNVSAYFWTNPCSKC